MGSKNGMAMKTPFFSAFGPLLFGRRKHRKTALPEEDFNAFQSVLGGHLGELGVRR